MANLVKVPMACEVGQEPLDSVAIDGKTKMGPWAWMCEDCHRRIGTGIGLGKGQKYKLCASELSASGRIFKKVAG
jgi:hypothetical protein